MLVVQFVSFQQACARIQNNKKHEHFISKQHVSLHKSIRNEKKALFYHVCGRYRDPCPSYQGHIHIYIPISYENLLDRSKMLYTIRNL